MTFRRYKYFVFIFYMIIFISMCFPKWELIDLVETVFNSDIQTRRYNQNGVF